MRSGLSLFSLRTLRPFLASFAVKGFMLVAGESFLTAKFAKKGREDRKEKLIGFTKLRSALRLER
jgi:hypothetical protein